MPARPRARRERLHRFESTPPVAGIFAMLALVLVLALVGSAARQPAGAATGEPTRLVLSSTATAGPPRRVGTTALYAKNDPWKHYLASEKVCPGGERTDLPLPRQARTVACLLNFARRMRGLNPLSLDAVLSRASARKASAIRRCERFAHNPCGGEWTSFVRALGYSGLFGENLYLASGVFGAPRPTVDAWLNSPPHRENVFGGRWRQQGLAVIVLPRFEAFRDVTIWVSVLGS
jgi:uncharacterized protein YkwD